MLSFFIDPSSDHLKQIMADHGGHYQHYYSMRSCTHIIATNLPDTKVKDLRLVLPQIQILGHCALYINWQFCCVI